MVTLPHRAASRIRVSDTRKRPPLSLEPLESRFLLSADAVLDWNAILLQANANDHGLAAPDQGGPGRTARAMAIVHTAMYDALNAIDGSHTPYLVDVQAPRGASMEAAVAQAAHDTLVALYPQQQAEFDDALRESLAGIPRGPRNRGVAVGREVAETTMAWRVEDGAQLADPPYEAGTLPGEHRPDPLHPGQGYLGVGWQRVLPFAMPDAVSMDVAPPPALTSREYTRAYNEVKAIGAENSTVRTPEQTIIAIFWGYDGSPGLGTPPRLYNQFTRTLAMQQGNSMVENARLFALVNIAMADAGIGSWRTKYEENLWRPIVGIREGDADGNPRTRGDADWRPLGAPCSNGCGAVTNFTPNFPAYTSGHATFGAAAFRTLAHFFGTDRLRFSFTSDEYNGVTRDQFGNVRPVVTRTYNSFSQAAEENGQSRIYLGIHWSFDKTAGIRQGNAIADYAFANYLLPVASPTGGDEDAGSMVASLLLPGTATVLSAPGSASLNEAAPEFDAPRQSEVVSVVADTDSAETLPISSAPSQEARDLFFGVATVWEMPTT